MNQQEQFSRGGDQPPRDQPTRDQPTRDQRGQRMLVVNDGESPVGAAAMPDGDPGDSEHGEDLASLVEQPQKVMRIGTMIKQLLEEVRAASLDEASRSRLTEIHRSSIRELEQGLAPELIQELERLSLPFEQERTPSESELRIAQAQLVGWLEGLFHGLQTALFAQQMAARAQLEQMRQGALPVGSEGDSEHQGPGQYL